MNTESSAALAQKPFGQWRRQTSPFDNFKTIFNDAKWWLLAATLVSGLCGLWLSSTLAPSYKAQAKIVLSESSDGVTPTVAKPGASQDAFYRTQVEIIQSEAVLLKVVEAMQLRERFKTHPELFDNTRILLPDSMRELPVISKLLEGAPNTEVGPAFEREKLDKLLVTKLQSALDVNLLQGSQVISISYQSYDTSFATELVSTLVSVYSQFSLNARLQSLENMESWRRDTQKDLLLQLQNAQQRLSLVKEQEVQLAKQLVLENTQNNAASESAIAQGTVNTLTQSELDILIRDFEAIAQGIEPSENFYTLLAKANDPSISSLLAERNALENKLEAFFPRYKEKHPKMIELRESFAQLDKALLEQSDGLVQRAEAAILARQAALSELSANIAQTDSQDSNSQTTPSPQFIAQTIEDLQAEVASSQNLYDTFVEQSQSQLVNGDISTVLVQMIEEADSPEVIQANKGLSIVLSLLLGFGIGMLAASIKAHFFDRLKTEKQLNSAVGLQSLGPMTLRARKDKAALPEISYLSKPHSHFAKDIDKIRAKLLNDDVDKPPKVILISSAQAGEGKTTLALNLAASLGQVGKTLLIEVNLRTPCISEVLKTPPYSGLTDVLTNTISAQEAVFKVIGPSKISVLSCGSQTNEALNIIKSAKFATLLESFKKEFDWIVLDGPQAMSLPDIEYLLPHADGLVLSAKSGANRISDTKKLLTHLKMHHGKIFGCVLVSWVKKRSSGRKRSVQSYNTPEPRLRGPQGPTLAAKGS